MALVIGTLAMFGFGAFTWFISGDNAVAVVNGEDIGETFLRAQVDRRRRQLATRENSEELLKQADTPEFSDRVLEEIIFFNLLDQMSLDSRLAVTDAALDGLIREDSEFQVDEKYDPEVFRQTLSAAGLTPKRYRDNVKQSTLRSQVLLGVIGTNFLMDAEFERAIGLSKETRTLTWLTVDTETLSKDISISSEEIQDYYNLYEAAYEIPEQLVVEYLELRQEALIEQIEVPEEDIKQAYEAQAAEFVPEENRLAAHILLDITEERDAEQTEQEILALKTRIEAGEDFAELAKEHSTDKGSGAQGGSLGMAGRGVYVPAFEEALWALEVDELSEPVTTQFGIHLVKLLEIGSSTFSTYEVLEEEIRNDIKTQQANELFAEQRRKLAEISYESSDLSSSSEALGLSLKQSEPFSHEGEQTGFASGEGVVEAAFSADVKEQGYNSPLLEPEDGVAIVLRLERSIERRQQTLEEVTEQIEEELKQSAALENAQLLATAAQTRLLEGDSREEVAADLELSWSTKEDATRRDSEVPAEVTEAAFELPRPLEGTGRVETVKVPEGMALVIVEQVKDGDVESLSERLVEIERKGLEYFAGRGGLESFRTALMSNARIDRR